MINVCIRVSNPFIRYSNFKSYFSKSGHIYAHKYWELQLSRDCSELFALNLDTRWSGIDHGGISFEITLFSLCWTVHVYDNRHWDYELEMWEEY